MMPMQTHATAAMIKDRRMFYQISKDNNKVVSQIVESKS
jgi:hypothetical protein